MKVHSDKLFQSQAFFSATPQAPRRNSHLVSQVPLHSRQHADESTVPSISESLELIQNFPLEPDLSGKLVQMSNHSGKTLVVDLDETLVHCTQCSAEVTVSLRFPSGRTTEVGVNVRPFAQQFLAHAAQLFEVVVFTASHKMYADAVLDYLDPQQKFVALRLYRNTCVLVNGVFVKDLRVLTGRELKDIVIIDNAVHSFGYQLDNGVPISSWYDDYDDCELSKIWTHLQLLAKEDDVRPLNSEKFGLSKCLRPSTHTLIPRLPL